MRRASLVIGALALAVALSSCSVATQDTATALPSHLRLSPTTTSTTLPNSKASHQLEVYFLRNGLLYPVSEPYATDPLSSALLALNIGPSAEEANRHITTAFSSSPAQITSVGQVNKGVALIEVDAEFKTLPGESLEQAFAQIVFTVTGLPIGATAVQFLYNGKKLDALIPPGQLINDRSVTRLDYCPFAPLSYLPCRRSTGTTGIT